MRMYVYMPVAKFPDGSRYKYYTLLQKEYGGIPLETDRLTAGMDEYQKELTLLGTQLESIVPDLIFLHGDWCSYYKLAIKAKIPYILFEQDVYSLRAANDSIPAPKYAKAKEQEQEMIESAAGVIFTSEDHVDYCLERYDVPNYEVIHLRPLKQDLAFAPLPKLPGKHLVYAGGITPNSGTLYGYRAYVDMLNDFQEAGWTVHIYTNKIHEVHHRPYIRAGMTIHPWLPYGELLKEMSQYTAGLQAYVKDGVPEGSFNYTQACRPNKVWDYLAANIPTIGLYPGNCAKIYEEGGWGLVVPDTKLGTLKNLELPNFPDSLRFEHVMEKDLDKFDRVIENALIRSKSKKVKKKRVKDIRVALRKGEVEVGREGTHWFRLEGPVMEDGKLLHGRGKRIPMSEALRLGLYKKETIKKEEVIKRVERKKKEKEKKDKKPVVKKEPKKELVKIEVKPLIEPPEHKEAHKPKRISVPTKLDVGHDKSEKKERDN